MQRDWPLVTAGFGVAAVSAIVVACLALGYRLEPDPCNARAAGSSRIAIDGCGPARPSFGDWLGQPSVIAVLVVAFVLLVIAAETIRRGLVQRA